MEALPPGQELLPNDVVLATFPSESDSGRATCGATNGIHCSKLRRSINGGHEGLKDPPK